MRNLSAAFAVGTRGSKLARRQTRDALDRLERLLGARFEMAPFGTPGDRDRVTDLRAAPADFFTRDLDEAVLGGRIDAAIHSAKDLPDPVPPGLDWCWLPWREDARDVLVLPQGGSFATLPARPRVGVSSDRREAWCRQRFPAGEFRPLRGDIEDRLRQLDAGGYDVVVMAAAALRRLGLDARIGEWIPLGEMPVPDGQGALGLTFRAGDRRWQRIRSLLVPAVVFAGAGPGSAELCTLATLAALRRCEVCLYDALLDPRLLAELPPGARAVDAGKRCGAHGKSQEAIGEAILRHARQGWRVVRLKGGDPGLFGRLSEEVELLDAHGLAYRVIPGVSSLSAATTGTGMLLTRRGVSRGFCALTPRQAGGALAGISGQVRAGLPVVLFMAVSSIPECVAALRAEGRPADEPAAVVFRAGHLSQRLVRGTLDDIAAKTAAAGDDGPGLFLAGEAARHGYRQDSGALGGRRVLLTCGEHLQAKAADRVLDLGGRPVAFPLIELKLSSTAVETMGRLAAYDWIALTSPAAARCFREALAAAGLDVRRVPRLMVCGPGSAAELAAAGLRADLAPRADFSAEGLAAAAAGVVTPGSRVLRFRSDAAPAELAAALRKLGATVDEAVLYVNRPTPAAAAPETEAALFASVSAVEVFFQRWPASRLETGPVAAIGKPTARALAARGIEAVMAAAATIEAAVEALAAQCVRRELETSDERHGHEHIS